MTCDRESLFGYRFKVVHKISKKDRENAWKLMSLSTHNDDNSCEWNVEEIEFD